MNTPVGTFNYAQSVGSASTNPFITIIESRAPTGNDGPNQKYLVGQRWVNASDGHAEYFLLGYISSGGVVQANWTQLSGGSGNIQTLTGDTGGPISPVAGNINIVGDGLSGATFHGAGNTLTAVLSAIPNTALLDSSITLVAGVGISISASPVFLGGTTMISATGAGFTWSVITSGSQNLVAGNGYFSNAGGVVTYTLPNSAAVGDSFRVSGLPTGNGWTIIENAGQSIVYGSKQTTATTGSLSSTVNTDSVYLVCAVANLVFVAQDSIGNLTVL
jgi:hypothetical protein